MSRPIINKTEEEIKEAKRIARKKYRDNNKDKVNKQQSKWKKANYLKLTKKQKEIKNIKHKKWAKDNPQKIKESGKKYYIKNKEKLKTSSNNWGKNNPDKIKEIVRKWRKANPEKIKQIYNNARKKRRNEDPLFRIKSNLRSMVSKVITRKGYTKKSKSYEILGCSFDEFKLYLESKFLPWMNWDNRGLYNGTEGYGWDIDHKIPLSSAKTEDELLKLLHYTNQQPLCSYINRVVKKDN